MIAHANRKDIYAPAKNRLTRTVQDTAIDIYRRALLSPLCSTKYGTKVSCPELVRLTKHVGYGDNKVAETTMKILFGAVSLGLPKSVVCRPFVVGHAIMSAQYPSDSPLEFADWSELETQIQAEFDCIQAKMWRGDFSTKTLTDAHERLTRMRELIDKALAWIEKRLYGVQS